MWCVVRSMLVFACVIVALPTAGAAVLTLPAEGRMLVTVRPHEAERTEGTQAAPLVLPRTELWWVKDDGSGATLAAVLLQNAEPRRWEDAASHTVRLTLTSLGGWAGGRLYLSGAVYVPWFDQTEIVLDLDTLEVLAAQPVPQSGDEDALRPADDGRVLEGKGPDDRFGLWVRPVGTDTPTLVLEGRYPQGFDVSPDGKLAILAKAPGYVGDAPIVVVDLQTAEVSDTGLLGVAPRWSPDGSQFLYSRGAHGGSWFRGIPVDGILCIADRDGSHAAPILQKGEAGLMPQWSPDGEWIAYLKCVRDGEDFRYEVHVVHHLDMSNTFRVAENCGGDFWWAADSEGIITAGQDAALYRFPTWGDVVRTALGDIAGAGAMTQEQQDAMAGAAAELSQVFHERASAKQELWEARLDPARERLAEVAAALRSAPERWPLARFVPWDLERYADRAQRTGELSDENVYDYVAHARMFRVRWAFLAYVEKNGRRPATIDDLRAWHLAAMGETPDQRESTRLCYRDPAAPAEEETSLVYRCPAADAAYPTEVITNPRRPWLRGILTDAETLDVPWPEDAERLEAFGLIRPD